MKPQRIAVLFHESDSEETAARFIISLLADHWRQDGHEVFNLFGVSKFKPADIVVVHIDLSVVPQDYLQFARRYPIVVNGEIADIRKSRYSLGMIGADDSYDGKVIVKTDLNFAGKPERARLRQVHSYDFASPQDYCIFERLDLVPDSLRSTPGLIVEKFLPETEDGLYCVRNYIFFGPNGYCIRMKSEKPIINSRTALAVEDTEPDPFIVETRKKLKIDYGKMDFVMADGKAVLLDVNKTMGVTTRASSPSKEKQRFRAQGLYSFFDQ